MTYEVEHNQHHVQLEMWCNEASQLLSLLVERIEALEQRNADLAARISEWEVGPR